MTPKEHELMLLMFARVFEAMGAITESLKSREIWAADDERAFRHLVQDDDSRLSEYLLLAYSNYIRSARSLGVLTGLESGPTAPSSP